MSLRRERKTTRVLPVFSRFRRVAPMSCFSSRAAAGRAQALGRSPTAGRRFAPLTGDCELGPSGRWA